MSISPTEKLLVEIIDHVALITINNPPANTWDTESLPGLKVIVEKLNDNKDIYALVITGSGEKFFSAGADLNIFADGAKEPAVLMSDHFGAAFVALADSRGVSIAAIDRIAEEQAQMALPETKVGLLACAGGTQRLSWLVGEGWAKRIILCGERVDARTAERIGLVEEVVARGEAKDKALALAAQVGNQSPIAVAYSKELIHQARNVAMEKALPYERQRFVDLFGTEDQLEGVNAFLEKRKPQWKNK